MKCFSLLVSLFAIALSSNAQIINTIAGNNGDGRMATSIGITPINQVVDAAGNIFIADHERHIVWKLSPVGIYIRFAGTGISGFSGDGGPATSAQLIDPYNVGIDGAGNVYITDGSTQRVRKVAANGIITTIAGNGTTGFSGDGGLAMSAQLNGPNAVTGDNAGNVYIADFSNNRVRKVDANGIITTFAGNGNFGITGEGGPAILSPLGLPIGVTVTAAGELLISDYGYSKIRKVSVNGIISTIAGSGYGTTGFSGDGGTATSAQFNNIAGSVAVDAAGSIFIPDTYNNRIRKVAANGIVTTVAGNGGNGTSGDGALATAAQIYNPTGVAIDNAGNILISSGHSIRRVTADGIIRTLAGNGSGGYSGDNVIATVTQIYKPVSVAVDFSGNVLFADGDNRIRQIDPNGIITTIAGTGIAGFSGDGGPAASAQINSPSGLAVDKAGNIFISDMLNTRIRKITTDHMINTVAGSGTNGFSGDGGLATSASFNSIQGLAIDSIGNIFVVDRNNQRVRKIARNGIITTVAGNGTAGFSGDGGNAISAQLSYPWNVAADASGNIFVADFGNYRIRKITADGIISTYGGNGNPRFSGDGGAATAAGAQPFAILTDASGNVFVADSDRIRKITDAGIISTVAGGGTVFGDGGAASAADLPGLNSIALNPSGNFYISDITNHRIRKISGSTLPLQLLTFKALQNNNGVLTSWQTTHEVNTANFAVQRSTDGTFFKTVGIVQAARDNKDINNYTYTDLNADQLNLTTLYYRLEMGDKDGMKTYSSVQKVIFTQPNFALRLLPNPAHVLLYVKGNNIKKITIADNLGRVLIQQVADNLQTTINISKLTKGMYIVNAYNANGDITSRKIEVN